MRSEKIPTESMTPPTATAEKIEASGAKNQPRLIAAQGVPWRLRSRETTLLLIFALVALTVAVYAPSLQNGFIDLDDGPYITENPVVRHGLSWPGIVWAFHTSSQSNWHPLTWISLMTDVQLFGMKPATFHVINLLLHSINVILVFLLLRAATGYLMRSALVAGLFAAFPMNVEAVAWAVERKSVLSTAFFLLALLAYVSYTRRPALAKYLGMMALISLSLMAKAWTVTFPFLLVLLDYWPLKRIGVPGHQTSGEDGFAKTLGKLVGEKIPLFAISIGSLSMSIWAGKQGGALSSPFAHSPFGLRLENATWSYLAYLLKGLWPVRLAIIYPFPRTMLPLWRVGLAAFVLLAISGVVWHYRERRYLLVGWLWFLGSIFPLSGLVQGGPQAWANRWAYISFLGLFMMIVWSVAEIVPPTRRNRSAAAVFAVVLIAAYAWEARIQTTFWRSGYTIFSRALAVAPDNAFAEDDLGIALDQEWGRPDLAMPHYERAVEVMPELSFAHYNLAIALQKQNRLDDATREYRLALANQPDASEVSLIHDNLAGILRSQQNWKAARLEYDLALQGKPNDPIILTNRGVVEAQQGDFVAARSDLQRAERIFPNPVTCFALGRVLEDSGDLPAAASAFETVLRMSPGVADVEVHLENVRRRLKTVSE